MRTNSIQMVTDEEICAVQTCNSSASTTPHLKFIALSKSQLNISKWAEICGTPCQKFKGGDSLICELHFPIEQFEIPSNNNKLGTIVQTTFTTPQTSTNLIQHKHNSNSDAVRTMNDLEMINQFVDCNSVNEINASNSNKEKEQVNVSTGIPAITSVENNIIDKQSLCTDCLKWEDTTKNEYIRNIKLCKQKIIELNVALKRKRGTFKSLHKLNESKIPSKKKVANEIMNVDHQQQQSTICENVENSFHFVELQNEIIHQQSDYDDYDDCGDDDDDDDDHYNDWIHSETTEEMTVAAEVKTNPVSNTFSTIFDKVTNNKSTNISTTTTNTTTTTTTATTTICDQPQQMDTWSNNDDKILAQSIYYKSPGVYQFLLNTLNIQLPDPKQLSQMAPIKRIQPGTAINETILCNIKEDLVKLKTAEERDGILIYDSITIRSDLVYSVETDSIHGFENYDESNEENRVAKSIYIFMIKGLNSQWNYILNYIAVDDIGPIKLFQVITQIIKMLRECCGIKTRMIVCQTYTNTINQRLFTMLEITNEKPYCIINGCKTYFMIDPFQLLNAIKSILLKADGNGIQTPTGIISWKIWKKLYDINLANGSRFYPKLTKMHISAMEHPGQHKMEIKLTLEIFNEQCAMAIRTLQKRNLFKGDENQMALATIEFIQHINEIICLIQSIFTMNSCSPNKPNTQSQYQLNFDYVQNRCQLIINYLNTIKCVQQKIEFIFDFIDQMILAINTLLRFSNNISMENKNINHLLPSTFNGNTLHEFIDQIPMTQYTSKIKLYPSLYQLNMILPQLISKKMILDKVMSWNSNRNNRNNHFQNNDNDWMDFDHDHDKTIIQSEYNIKTTTIKNPDDEEFKFLQIITIRKNAIDTFTKPTQLYVASFILYKLNATKNCQMCKTNYMNVNQTLNLNDSEIYFFKKLFFPLKINNTHIHSEIENETFLMYLPNDEFLSIIEKHTHFFSMFFKPNAHSSNLHKLFKEMCVSNSGQLIFKNLYIKNIDNHQTKTKNIDANADADAGDCWEHKMFILDCLTKILLYKYTNWLADELIPDRIEIPLYELIRD